MRRVDPARLDRAVSAAFSALYGPDRDRVERALRNSAAVGVVLRKERNEVVRHYRMLGYARARR